MEKLTETYIKELLKKLVKNGQRAHLSQTPRRVAKAYEKFFSGYEKDPKEILTVFENEGYDEMVTVHGIEFFSLCEHHFLPFFGKAHVGYLPDKKIVGLSKIPRIVDIFSRRLQTQERLTSQVAQTLMDLLKPKGVGVILEARHLCMMARGVAKQGSSVTTSAMLGRFKTDARTRGEFLRLIGK